MDWLRRALRGCFASTESGLDRVFPASWNPLYHLGALGFFFYWIVAVSGIYLYIFFDTGTTAAYDSVQYLTNAQWYLGGVMRSLHRYASDGLVLVMMVHMAREFALDRYRGARWFTWFTGVPVLWLVFIAGITGYWLVWDRLAQYVALATTEWFDWLPIFGSPIARNFLAPDTLDDRFFTLMIFIHIAVPLILLLVLWIHLQRLSRPEINPARGLAVGSFLAMLALSFVMPATSQGPADLSTVVSVVHLDWFYLGLYPLLDMWSDGIVWGVAGVLTLMIAAVPWLPPLRRAAMARVALDHCNGCARCVADCPYNAIDLGPRTDGLPFEREAVVDAELCVSCGICAGACPSATPFRRSGELLTGIDLPDRALAALRDKVETAAATLSGEGRVLVFGCDHGASAAALTGPGVAMISLPCIGNLPPPFIDFVLSRDLADGVFLTGCQDGNCIHRFGERWTEDRIARVRDPYLRQRVPRERLAWLWAGAGERKHLARAIADFRERLQVLSKEPPPALRAAAPSAPREEEMRNHG